ncbi:hypothetical protein LguiA_017271 [Lonicera macranthoides]
MQIKVGFDTPLTMAFHRTGGMHITLHEIQFESWFSNERYLIQKLKQIEWG